MFGPYPPSFGVNSNPTPMPLAVVMNIVQGFVGAPFHDKRLAFEHTIHSPPFWSMNAFVGTPNETVVCDWRAPDNPIIPLADIHNMDLVNALCLRLLQLTAFENGPAATRLDPNWTGQFPPIFPFVDFEIRLLSLIVRKVVNLIKSIRTAVNKKIDKTEK